GAGPLSQSVGGGGAPAGSGGHSVPGRGHRGHPGSRATVLAPVDEPLGRGPQPAAPDQRRTDQSAGPAGDRRDGADGALPPSRSVPPGRRRKSSMTTPSHADIQTGALPLPVLTVSRWSRVIALLVALALIGGVACLQFGSERIPLGDVARLLLSGGHESLAVAAGARRGGF